MVLGAIVMVLALWELNWRFDPLRVAAFPVLFTCGVMLAYSFMLMLASFSVWLVRNQSLMEMWWLFSSLARYPREIFIREPWAEPIGRLFTYVIPILLVSNMPAQVMVRALEPGLLVFTVVATVAGLYLSRRFFRFALRSYRSASS